MTSTANTTQLSEPIALSDAGAVRAFDLLSVDAAALLMGMIRVTSKTGGGEAVIAQAAASMGMPRKPAVQGFKELRRCGLLRQREDDVLILHRLFSSYGHELSKRKQNRGAVGHVIQLSKEIA
jgi:hypothetical protein